MRKCIICEKEIENKEFEICETCRDFLMSKYNGDLNEELCRFRKTRKYLDKWRLQKEEKEVEE